jgi:hypothetical protein
VSNQFGIYSLFGHPRRLLAGIHPKNFKDGCPIKNVGHDDGGWRFPIHAVGNNHDGDGFRTRSMKRISLSNAAPPEHRSFAMGLG